MINDITKTEKKFQEKTDLKKIENDFFYQIQGVRPNFRRLIFRSFLNAILIIWYALWKPFFKEGVLI